MWDWMRIQVLAAMVIFLAACPKLATMKDSEEPPPPAQPPVVSLTMETRPAPTTQPIAEPAHPEDLRFAMLN